MYEWMDGCMYEWRWMDVECMNGYIGECMNRCGWMVECMNGWMGEWMGGEMY